MLKVKKCKYGRGVFATENIKKGTILTTDNLLVLTSSDRKIGETISRYDFQYKDTSGLALGISSLFNHSKSPSADFETFDFKGMPYVAVTAIKNIKKGQQIFVDYGYDPTEYPMSKKVKLKMPLDLLQRIEKVAERVHVTRDQVISVILAIELEKAEDLNGSENKRTNKKSNVKSSSKSRLAKRTRSR